MSIELPISLPTDTSETIMRVVYMGTPFFAAKVLEHLLADAGVEVVGVYTQPDKQAGRGKKFQESETKILAQSHNIPIFQPVSFKNNPESVAELKALSPDMLVVAAYGMLLPDEVLQIPRLGSYNVHASLLPKYRGAAPVQRGLLAGDAMTGITIMAIESGLDTGAILLQQAASVQDNKEFSHNSGDLLHELADMGGKLMVNAIKMVAQGRVFLVEQNNDLATYAKKLTKAEAVIDWTKSADEIHNHVRCFSPNPGATSSLRLKEDTPVRIEKGFPLERIDFNSQEYAHGEIGQILGIFKNYLVVRCGQGHYGITQIRLAGKGSMDAKSFYNGYMKKNENICFF